MAENGTIAYVTEKPECDVCKHLGTDSEKDSPARAEYDAKTKNGQWAFICEGHKHFMMYPQLGVGRGQKLEIRA